MKGCVELHTNEHLTRTRLLLKSRMFILMLPTITFKVWTRL